MVSAIVNTLEAEGDDWRLPADLARCVNSTFAVSISFWRFDGPKERNEVAWAWLARPFTKVYMTAVACDSLLSSNHPNTQLIMLMIPHPRFPTVTVPKSWSPK